MAKNKHISGIGGWLVYLIFGLMVLGPLSGAGRLSMEFSVTAEKFPHLASDANWINYKDISWGLFWLSSAIGFSAGYRLWKLHFPESVRFAVIALWVIGPVAGVTYLVAGILIFGMPSSANYGQVIGPILGSAIVAGIWTAYLKRSVRVKNTYKLTLPGYDQQP